MIAGKTALEALGLSKGDDIKDAAMFANVVTTMVTAWIKEEGLKLTKAQMTSELDTLRKACEVSTEQALKEVEVFVQGKK
jgi:trehalose-6-phosphatase